MSQEHGHTDHKHKEEHKHHEHKHDHNKAHDGGYPSLSKLEVDKLGNFEGGEVLEASKFAAMNDPHPTGTLTSPALMALSKVLGTACVEYNAAFFECKARTRNPEKCEREGLAVTGCAKNVLQLVRERCQRPYASYATCLNSNNLEFRFCRDFQNSFHDCITEADPALGAAMKAWEDTPNKKTYKSHSW